jgi:hypothetical protein
MATDAAENGGFPDEEWRLRSVDLVLGPARDLHSLFGALAAAAGEAELVPHTVHCAEGRDGFRLVASCDVESECVTMEGIVRILRRDPGGRARPASEAVA